MEANARPGFSPLPGLLMWGRADTTLSSARVQRQQQVSPDPHWDLGAPLQDEYTGLPAFFGHIDSH